MSFTAITNDLVLSAALANEYTGALREREQADGGAAITPICTVGQDGQAAALFVSWQQACEDLVDTGKWVEDKSYHGEATIPVYTWTTLKTAAGIPSGFRRATTKPADWTDYDDAAFVDAGYGHAQDGDIRGPWLLADLQAVLKELVATKPGGLSEFEPEDQAWRGATLQSGTPDWDTIIKPDAEAEWSSEPTWHSPICRSWLQESMTQRYGELVKCKAGVEFTGGSLWNGGNGISRACDWYVYTEPSGYGSEGHDVYDANGENVVKDRWALWTGAGSAEATENPQSPWCPVADVDNPLPVWPATNPPGVATYCRGFYENGWECVVRWNVLGGFEYV